MGDPKKTPTPPIPPRLPPGVVPGNENWHPTPNHRQGPDTGAERGGDYNNVTRNVMPPPAPPAPVRKK